MPFIDRDKRLEAVEKSQKNIYEKAFNVRIRRDSGIVPCLEKAAKDANQTAVAYMIEATREKLIREGYMTEDTD